MVTQKLNTRNEKIIITITNKYEVGLYSIKLEESYYNFIEGEELIENNNKILSITKEEWNLSKNKNLFRKLKDTY